MEWSAHLVGDETALQILAKSLGDPDLSVTYEAGEYLLRSSQFATLETAGEVREIANQTAQILTGMGTMLIGYSGQIQVGEIYRRNDRGGRDIWMRTEPGALRIRGLPVTFTVTRRDGTVENDGPAEVITRWARSAMSNPQAAKALRLLQSGELNWRSLYVLYEVVEGAAGTPAVDGWITEPKRRLFKHTTNSVGALGDEARHGKETGQPPSNPMPLKEARELIRSLVRSWLQSL